MLYIISINRSISPNELCRQVLDCYSTDMETREGILLQFLRGADT